MTPLPHFGRSAGMLARLGAGGRSDIFNLYAARAARGLGDGFAAIILPAYLLELGFNPFEIGIVATAALLGSAATTLAIGYLAPRYDGRTLLLVCAVLMVLTGIAIPQVQHLVFIAAIAFVGTMNPTTGDIGIHIPLEQASLAQGASDKERTHVFARYSPCSTSMPRSAWWAPCSIRGFPTPGRRRQRRKPRRWAHRAAPFTSSPRCSAWI